MIIVTYHLTLKVVIIRFDKKNPKIFPIHDIEVQNPICDPYFLECQCLLMSARIVCQVDRCENPYPIIDAPIAISIHKMLLLL